MKARRIDGLDGALPLAENVARILAVRVDELCSLAAPAFDPSDETALHDLRIAAKRLRYVLEVTGEACVGGEAAKALVLLKELQRVLGEIHDCDEMLPMLAGYEGPGIEALVARVRARRAERFGGFVSLWPAVKAAATSCSHRAGVNGLGSSGEK